MSELKCRDFVVSQKVRIIDGLIIGKYQSQNTLS